MANNTTTFDPVKYKETTKQQWQSAAQAWHKWGGLLGQWLGPATEIMFDMIGLAQGAQVLDVAAGAGEQSMAAARRIGSNGRVLATDISPNILEFAKDAARQAGLTQIDTRVVDGETIDLPEGSFDAVISRVGLIYFPDQQKALRGMRHVLKQGGRIGAIVYSTADKNPFFSQPVAIIRRRANLPPPMPGQPGPFSLGAPGALEKAFEQAGFRDIHVRTVQAPLRMASAQECLQFEKESFGALHQMLSGLSAADQDAAWEEILGALKAFEGSGRFEGPCELVVGSAAK